MVFRIHFASLEHSKNWCLVEAGSILEPVERDRHVREEFI